MITVVELYDNLIKWAKTAQVNPNEVAPKLFDNLDTTGLDAHDIMLLNRYYMSLGNLLGSLANKQKYHATVMPYKRPD